ncbi:MAG TPA: GTP 3',8-cyclase MoaA [Actinomycetota bacterium]|nr:GTP 3',8-cyclase MoaA [Actinomycetota bacterium]
MPSALPPLTDTFGRIADDLRISVTDRCNFRCVYCMPEEGLEWLHKSKLLTFEEIARLAGIFVNLGVKTFRLTGGEPTLRRELPTLVAMLRSVSAEADIAMTTNGFLLEEMAGELAAAGLTRLNVSVDSLMRHRFAEVTRRDALDKVMRGLRAAEDAGLKPLKLNCVVVRGTNDDELLEFARLSRSTGYEVRFIEYMPLDAEKLWERDLVVPSDEIISTIGKHFELEPVQRGVEPASVWRFSDGAPGSVGVIASVTAPFCGTCNRIRITADGQFRTCLFSLVETDLRKLIRTGADDDEIAGSVRSAVSRKESGHLINSPDFVRPERSMSMIGG